MEGTKERAISRTYDWACSAMYVLMPMRRRTREGGRAESGEGKEGEGEESKGTDKTRKGKFAQQQVGRALVAPDLL